MYKDTSTYFLMGLYMTKKAYKEDLTLIHYELQSRWKLPERKSEFDEYFSNWDLTPKHFNLEGDVPTFDKPAIEIAKKIIEKEPSDPLDLFFD